MFPFCSSLPHRLCLLPSHPGPRGPPPSTFWAQADPVLSPINTLPPVFQKGAHLLLADDSSLIFPLPGPFGVVLPFCSFAHLCQRLYSLLCWEWQEDRLAGPGVRPQGATGPAPRASEVVGEAEFVSLFARWERRICWWGSKRHVFVKILRKLWSSVGSPVEVLSIQTSSETWNRASALRTTGRWL